MSNAVHRYLDGDTFPVFFFLFLVSEFQLIGSKMNLLSVLTFSECSRLCFIHIVSYVFWTAQEDNDRAAVSALFI